MMQTLTLSPLTISDRIFRCRPVKICVEGLRRRDLEVVEWRLLREYPFARATLVKRLPRIVAGGARMEDVSSLPQIGSSVSIHPPRGYGSGRLPARVVAHRSEFTPQAERLVVVVEHALAEALESVIDHCWRWGSAGAVRAENAPVNFNDGLKGRASSQVGEINGRQCRVFSSDADAIRWTVADALGYLVAAYAPSYVEAPGLEELGDLAGEIDLGRLDVTGMVLWEALAKVAGRGGLATAPGRNALGLVFYQPGRTGRRRRVCLQRVGALAQAGDSNLWRGSVVFRRRCDRPAILALGRHKRYESTFNLQPGWYEGDETSRWRDFIRSDGEDWPQGRNVYRKWVLNEHGWYSGSPWLLDVYDFSQVSAEDFYLRVPRRFEQCISVNQDGESFGVAVQFRCGQQDEWRAWGGPVKVSSDECAIYLAGDAIPGEYFQAAVMGQAEVRVTAAVRSDVRLAVEIPGVPNLPRRIIDLSDRAAWSAVQPQSMFSGDDGASVARDDTDMLLACARRYAQAATGAMEAELTLPWPDTSYGVGDLIERVDGRGLNLRASGLVTPYVRSVRHRFGQSQTTTLTVSG